MDYPGIFLGMKIIFILKNRKGRLENKEKRGAHLRGKKVARVNVGSKGKVHLKINYTRMHKALHRLGLYHEFIGKLGIRLIDD